MGHLSRLITCTSVIASLNLPLGIAPLLASPMDEDIPEEVLRTEIILEARSPVDGEPLTAAEYAVLQEDLAAQDRVPELPSDVQHTIFLLRILRTIRVFSPL